ncbi:MAG: hypothetical protein AAFQ43_13515, partial [Bacteroidota bacterium]
ARNPNLLVAGSPPALWLIDHGAALYFHHNWDAVDEARARAPFAPIRDHVLLPIAGDLDAADARLADRLSPEAIAGILAAIPDALFMDAPEGRTAPFESADANREAYGRFFRQRLAAPRAWVQAAREAQQALSDTDDAPLPYRR